MGLGPQVLVVFRSEHNTKEATVMSNNANLPQPDAALRPAAPTARRTSLLPARSPTVHERPRPLHDLALDARTSLGGQEHRHRPAALAGHGLHGVHVDAVLVLGPGPLQRLGAPRVLVHRVVGVLEQVGARLVDEPVGVPCLPMTSV